MASLVVINVAQYEPLSRCAVGDSELKVRDVGPCVELGFPDGRFPHA